MQIRRAIAADMPGINKLLCQVLMVHHNGRPDLFKANAKKYTDEELMQMIADDKTPIFVAVEENALQGEILGYAFCVFQQHINNNILTDVKSLYIDDLCVDEEKRGLHVGKRLYEYVLDYAKEQGCYNVTLNVWSCNENAMRFYEKCGLVPQKVGMEKIL
nr:GNAT family N-acetyltransferase [Lachnospiraceae bacterium]